MRLLIIYGAGEGQTRKICEFLKSEAEKSQHDVELTEVTESFHYPEDFDAIIIGTPVTGGNFHPAIHRYLEAHKNKLNNKPGILLAVSLAASDPNPEPKRELEQITRAFLRKTGWHPHQIEYVGEVINHKNPTESSRMETERSGRESRTYTDWKQVRDVLSKLERRIGKAISESRNPVLYTHATKH